MAEIGTPEAKDKISSTEPSRKLVGSFYSIWPPSQKTRDAVVARLVEALSSPSILSKRYGTVSGDEADEIARRIEEEAFIAAEELGLDVGDGIEILQVYSKEVSKRMLDAVKSRSAASAATAAVGEAEEEL